MRTILVLLMLFSCQKDKVIAQKKNLLEMKNNEKNNNDKIKNILEKQVLYGYATKEAGFDEISDYPYTIEDYNASIYLVTDILKNHSYKFLSQNEFKTKVKEIFKYSENNDLINYLIEYNCPTTKQVFQLDENYVMSNANPLFIDIRHQLITEAYFLPLLTDYQREFPSIYQKEKDMSTDRDNVKIIKWQDISDLLQMRYNNIQTLVHRNKYLFNDNKASFAWLKFNDGYFLQSLVKVFGYDKDKELNAFVLRENLKNTEEFGKLLWNKPCGGKAQLNMGIIENITSLSDEEQKVYYKQVLDFLYQIRLGEVDLEISFSEQAEILGKLGYYLTKNAKETDFYFRINNEIKKTDGGYFPYEKEFEKNNYYNLPDFKKIWDDTKDGGMWDIRPQAQENDKSKVINENKVLPLYSRPDWNSFFQDIRVEEEIKYIHKVSGWDYVKIGDQLGYFPPIGEEKLIKKHSFLVEDEPLPKKEKGFWDKLFG